MKRGFKMNLFEFVGDHTTVAEPMRIPHVASGYRPQKSLVRILPSVVTIHNQTLNVWTHVAGLLWFLYAAPVPLFDAYSRGSAVDVATFAVFLTSACLCFLFSSLYHLFSSAAEAWVSFFFALDLLGIGLLILGSYVIGVYQGFYCQPLFVGMKNSDVSSVMFSSVAVY